MINIVGVRWFAKINNALVWWKLGTLVLVAVILFASEFSTHVFTDGPGGFAPSGTNGILTAVASGGIVFTFLGCRQAVEMAAETTEPHRNVPFALIGSAVVCGGILILLQIALIGSIPSGELAEGWSNLGFGDGIAPLAGLATALGITALVFLIRVDAVISPFDTGLIYAAATVRLSYAQGRNGNAPRWLTLVNRRGVPWTSTLLMFGVGCIFFLPFPSWQRLVGFITAALLLSFGSAPVAVAALRRQLPEQERPFRVPGGDVIPYLALVAISAIVYWSGWETIQRIMVAVLIGFTVLVAYYRLARDRAHLPPIELKAGLWAIIWFAGLTLVSAVGTYGGGMGILDNRTSVACLAVLSAVVYWVALKLRLPHAEVVANIRRQQEA